MSLVQYTAEVKGSLLLELPAEAEELHLKPGDKIEVKLDRTATKEEPTATPNEELLAMLREIAVMKAGMKPTDGAETDRLLREARTGAMYGGGSKL